MDESDDDFDDLEGDDDDEQGSNPDVCVFCCTSPVFCLLFKALLRIRTTISLYQPVVHPNDVGVHARIPTLTQRNASNSELAVPTIIAQSRDNVSGTS